MKIESGTGNGEYAKVGDGFRLFTRSHTLSVEGAASRNGDAYFANSTDTANTLTTATGNTYNILYLKNTSSTKNMIIEKVLSSADTEAGVVVWKKNMTLGSVSAENTHTPVNLNYSSGKSAEVTAYNWDETGTTGIGGLSGGTTIKSFITGVGFTVHPIDGAMVLANGDSITIQYVNGTGGNIEFECGIRFYFEDNNL